MSVQPDSSSKKRGKKKGNVAETAVAETAVAEAAAPLQISNAAGEEFLALSAQEVVRYRQWHTRLNRSQPFPGRLGVLSALHGEGVTTVALGLAVTLAADTEGRVGLIELNWWWPALAERAKIAASPGAAQVLAGEVALEAALQSTSLDNLWLLPAGEMPETRRSRQARSQALSNLLDELGARCDHLICDIPAILATDDAVAQASLCQALCLVIRQGATPLSLVRQALDEIEHLSVRGVVFNAEKLALPKWLLRLIPGG